MSTRRSELVFRGELVGVGRFRCHPSDPSFCDTGPIGGYLFVFPREPVTITHAGRAPIVADPNCVMFYNDRQEYRRGAISPAGDRCEFFAVSPDAVRAAVRAHAPGEAELERPFGPLTHGPCDARSYLLQRGVYEHVCRGHADPLLVEEAVLALLDRMVAAAFAARGAPRGAETEATRRAHTDLAMAARLLLARRFAEPMSLGAVAAAVATSPFHLSRVFRRHVGCSLHAFRTQLRVRAAANRVLGGADDLTALALDLGFSSHSHLSSTFRSVFGVAPSRLRRMPTAALRTILQG